MSEKSKNWKKEWRSNILWIGGLILFESFLFQPFNVPSGSMIPTLSLGDEIITSKFSYGYSSYSWPVPWTSINFIKGRIKLDSPHRGDVVVFKNPRNIDEDYVKRLIGLPGDKIQVTNGDLYLNGNKIEDAKLSPEEQKEYKSYPYGERMEGHWVFYKENLPTGNGTEKKDFVILKLNDGIGKQNNTEEYTVPQGKYFVMGDDRDNSLDSRFMDTGVGFLPEENLVGKAQFILYSLKPTNLPFPLSILDIPLRIRWDKFFNKI